MGNMTPAMRELSTMRHKELQIACIVRGMDSKEMVESDHHDLVVFFTKNYERTQDQTLLPIHHAWVENELKNNGYKKGDLLMSPALRLGYVGNIEEMEKPKLLKPNIITKEDKKPVSKMDEVTGVRQGTKKALTYDLVYKKMSIEKIIKEVIKKFPEAKEKSIKIWAKKAKNNM